MKTPRRDIALAVAHLLHEGKAPRAIAAGLAHYLVQERRVRELDAILREVATLRAEQYGIVEASVITAVPLTESLAQTARQLLADYLGSSRAVLINASVDPSLVGGIKISAGEYELDATVRSALRRLHPTSSLKGAN